MQVRTWFGIFTIREDKIVNIELFQKDIDSITDRLMKEPLLLRGKVAGTDLRDLALNSGFVRSNDEYDSMLHEINIRIAKQRMAQAVTQDKKIIAAVEAIDDIDETTNILAERLKEWYMLNLGETDLRGKQLALHIIQKKDNAAGHDLEIMQSFASSLLGLYGTRLSIEDHLKEKMPVLAPNLTNIAGHILGARLLSAAGSLEKLASMPSSTVQVVGASNAIFKHLKGKASSPKHGLIFRHPLVNTAPKRLRGKMARAVASKIALAARYDYYSGELREELLTQFESKVSLIKKRGKKAHDIESSLP